jgi:hypothetical protein
MKIGIFEVVMINKIHDDEIIKEINENKTITINNPVNKRKIFNEKFVKSRPAIVIGAFAKNREFLVVPLTTKSYWIKEIQDNFRTNFKLNGRDSF